MNHFLYIVLKKTRLNRWIYNIRKSACHEYADMMHLGVSNARNMLDILRKDPKSSCICRNEIDDKPEYDLQIIIPAYNVEKYIAECLDSVLAQRTKYKYILKVINDGSTDGTMRVLEKYKNKESVHIMHQKNQGLSGARNRGLRKIEARYVMFIDSDDKLALGAIESLMDMAEKTRADIVEGASRKFYKCVTTKRYHHVDCEKITAERLFGFAWGKVYKAELFANIQFPEGYWFEDTICSLVLYSLAKKISSIKHQVYCYRTNFSGISRTFGGNPKCIDSFYISEQLLLDREKLGLSMDDSWSSKIATQFRLNSNRASSLNNEEVDKALFILQSYLLKKYFGHTKISDPVVKSLLENDYTTFKLQMKWM